MYQLPVRIIFILSVFLASSSFALDSYSSTLDKPLAIVTDTWPPYVIQEKLEISGIDVDIARHVFKDMGTPIDIQILPWKRSLEMVKHKKADGILSAMLTSSRQEFLYYPENPVSIGNTVLFAQKNHIFDFNKIKELDTKRTGTMLGHSFCESLDNTTFVKNSERVSNLELNFKKLMANRLDIVVESDAVGLYTLQKMGIAEHISIVPNLSFCHDGNYLGFSKKPGYDALAEKFSQALTQFKETAEYQSILQKYGL